MFVSQMPSEATVSRKAGWKTPDRDQTSTESNIEFDYVEVVCDLNNSFGGTVERKD